MPPTIDLSLGASRTIVVPAGRLCAQAPPRVAKAVAEAVASTILDGSPESSGAPRVEVEHIRRDGGHVCVNVAGTEMHVALTDVLIGFRSTALPAMRAHYGLPPRPRR